MVDIKPFVQKHLYSARVENHTKRPLTVEGTYAECLPSSDSGEVREEKMIIPLRPGDAKTFGSKIAENSKMHLVRFFVTDGENGDKTLKGPFVPKDRDRETFIIEQTEDDPFKFYMKSHQ